MEETMFRLSAEIELALAANDVARATRAQKQLSRVQMEKPSAACRVIIQNECRRATQLLQMGETVSVEERVKAAKKLGWWLRWRRMGSKRMVPAGVALEGLLWALRSEPEVAWTAQCALYHATRCSDGVARSVSEGPQGAVARFLLSDPAPFPFYLPRPTKRTLENYARVLKTDVAYDFFMRLKGLTLVDPGYGESAEADDVTRRLKAFSKVLGRSLRSLESLSVLGFEDCAMTSVLSRLALPKLTSLTIMGACHTAEAQQAIVSTLRRHGDRLEQLELNVHTDFLSDAADPLADVGVMPNLKRLTIRAPPLSVPWEHFAECFPALEELTFLYSQDFARNAVSVLHECDHPGEQQDLLRQHARWLYRDAGLFAKDLHERGFARLAKSCERLREIRLAIMDSSNGYDVTPPEERLTLLWRRDMDPAVSQLFRRDAAVNNDARGSLEAQADLLEHAYDYGDEWWDYDDETWAFSDSDEDYDLDDYEYEVDDEDAMEEAADIASSVVQLQVLRLFDDPSIEADFGLSSASTPAVGGALADV